MRPPAITALLPLFRDNAHSLAIIKHGMDVLKYATEYLNEGQIPVLEVDQPHLKNGVHIWKPDLVKILITFSKLKCCIYMWILQILLIKC